MRKADTRVCTITCQPNKFKLVNVASRCMDRNKMWSPDLKKIHRVVRASEQRLLQKIYSKMQWRESALVGLATSASHVNVKQGV